MPLLRWMFVSRKTGRITVAQWPNAPLWVWIVCTLLPVHAAWVGWVGTAGLAVWALLEVGAGVNPWRRLLGLAGLAVVARTLFS